LAGRILFGTAGESLTLSQISIIADWFHNRELAFAISLNAGVSKIGKTLSFNFFLFPKQITFIYYS
jgi:hypothetical protein